MIGKEKIVAMIPARIGSTRLPMKNLALIDGAPMISYAINAAKESGVFDRIVINGDDPLFGNIAERYGVEFYLRPGELGSSTTKSDFVVQDFMRKHPADILCWVNPTSPLQTGAEIRAVVEHFVREELDTLITVCREQVHASFQGQPINYRPDEVFAQTQDLVPVDVFVYSVMAWRNKSFLAEFHEKGQAFFVGKFGVYPVSKMSGIIIKRKEDLQLVENIVKSLKTGHSDIVSYDPLAQERENG
ncbi:MAG: acylneuraminate cytidylyltransferase family protein [Deltaproteobacteria bacterium]|nr:acylneuraminate cytidylyltransferase family protein [Deltaproteobacteria bacterium]